MSNAYLIASPIAAVIIAYLLFYLFNKNKTAAKKDFESLNSKYNEAITTLKINEERANTLQKLNSSQEEKIATKETEVSALRTLSATLETNLKNSENKSAELTKSFEKELENNKIQQAQINNIQQKTAGLSANYQSALETIADFRTTHTQQTKQIEELNEKFSSLTAKLSEQIANNNALTEKLSTQKTEIENLQKTAHLQFEKIAQQIFEDKSQRFTETNKKNIETLLNPLKEDIGKFKTKVEETYDKESKQRFSLEQKVKELIEQTNKVSSEANNLANALKGQTKKQGNWGEMILERILETSGLSKNREYFVQQTIKDEEGKNLRPDILIKLPEERIIIIDSKVSLIAYDRFCTADNSDEQKIHLAEHLKSIYGHIDDLSSKKYDNMENSLDFTMMFIPIEPAYLLAIQANQDLWSYAYSKRILLISPTNLIACLKLISDLWKREQQSKNAMDIVKRGELLYEKFVTFTSSVEEIGKHLNKTQTAYSAAIDQLKNGRGNLVSQAMQLQNLGLKSGKKIAQTMLPTDFEAPNSETQKMADE